ncbi:hypothetical protein [Streptomyces sp. NPDC004533]|uniref:hypothetical protein n=1 Tax=Streptomyces sp. NPDC004533 TaxID=3154278 RepID=UPI0033A8EECD
MSENTGAVMLISPPSLEAALVGAGSILPGDLPIPPDVGVPASLWVGPGDYWSAQPPPPHALSPQDAEHYAGLVPAFRAVLGRDPSRDEASLCLSQLANNPGNRTQVYQSLLPQIGSWLAHQADPVIQAVLVQAGRRVAGAKFTGFPTEWPTQPLAAQIKQGGGFHQVAHTLLQAQIAQAYNKIYWRWPRIPDTNLTNQLSAAVDAGQSTIDLIWTAVATRTDSVRGPYKTTGNGDPCFGAAGSGCDPLPLPGNPSYPNPLPGSEFVRLCGLHMNLVQKYTSVGSIWHDTMCRHWRYVEHGGDPASWNQTVMCNGNNLTADEGCPMFWEWNKAWWDTFPGRSWTDIYGPYPVDGDLRRAWIDDVRFIPARPGSYLSHGSTPVRPYAGLETRATSLLQAPTGQTMDPTDAAYCKSRQLDGNNRCV